MEHNQKIRTNVMCCRAEHNEEQEPGRQGG